METAERKGEKKGMLKEKIETARKMKADGFVVDLIAKYLEFTYGNLPESILIRKWGDFVLVWGWMNEKKQTNSWRFIWR